LLPQSCHLRQATYDSELLQPVQFAFSEEVRMVPEVAINFVTIGLHSLGRHPIVKGPRKRLAPGQLQLLDYAGIRLEPLAGGGLRSQLLVDQDLQDLGSCSIGTDIQLRLLLKHCLNLMHRDLTIIDASCHLRIIT